MPYTKKSLTVVLSRIGFPGWRALAEGLKMNLNVRTISIPTHYHVPLRGWKPTGKYDVFHLSVRKSEIVVYLKTMGTSESEAESIVDILSDLGFLRERHSSDSGYFTDPPYTFQV